MSKIKINEVIVVEGRDDTNRLKQFFEVDTYETHGIGIDEKLIQELKTIAKKREIIIFTDPDYAGKSIRAHLEEAIPNALNAYLPRAEGVPKNKGSLGIEHASFEALKTALDKVRRNKNDDKNFTPVTSAQLNKLGLCGQANSRELREKVGDKLGIGYYNAKQLAKRLEINRITYEELKDVVDLSD
ncbi:MAG: ribonuclease M5 [Lactobacillales bacterium]|jgi:ribonuclease M5|nr:ribonuclease M5 [Lactobacillales bacterium]